MNKPDDLEADHPPCRKTTPSGADSFPTSNIR